MYRDDGHSFYFFCFFSVSFPPPPDPLMPNILSFLLSPLLHLIPCVSIILHGSTTDAFDAHPPVPSCGLVSGPANPSATHCTRTWARTEGLAVVV